MSKKMTTAALNNVTAPRSGEPPLNIWKELAAKMSSTKIMAPLPQRFPLTMAQAPTMTKPKTIKINSAVPSPTKLSDPESETIEPFSAPLSSRTIRKIPKQMTAMD